MFQIKLDIQAAARVGAKQGRGKTIEVIGQIRVRNWNCTFLFYDLRLYSFFQYQIDRVNCDYSIPNGST